MVRALKAAIFTEASPSVGLGHLRRCEALGEHLERAGIRVEFFLNTSPLEVKNLSDFPLCVVDSYLLPLAAYEYASKESKLAIFFDDTLRLKYPKAIIINGALNAPKMAYKGDHRLWLGEKYALVRREFLDLKKKLINADISQVLITFGGSASAQETQEALAKNLREKFKKLTIKTIKSADNLSAAQICALMQESDVAISAGGGTLNELAACGVPTIALLFAENQRTNLESWEEREAIVRAENLQSAARILSALSFEARSAMSARFFAISQEAKWKQNCEEILRLMDSSCAHLQS